MFCFRPLRLLISLLVLGLLACSSTSPLIKAVTKNDYPKAKSLIDKGADIKVTTKTGFDLLTLAILNENVDMVKLLLDHGFDLKSEKGTMAFMVTAIRGNVSILKILLDRGVANINVQRNYDPNKLQWTPLIAAAYHGHKDCVQLLLDRGANVNVVSRTYVNADIDESRSSGGYTTYVRTSGLRKEASDKTALGWAKVQGHTEIVELLKKYGAEE